MLANLIYGLKSVTGAGIMRQIDGRVVNVVIGESVP